jgi:hypothetical protein
VKFAARLGSLALILAILANSHAASAASILIVGPRVLSFPLISLASAHPTENKSFTVTNGGSAPLTVDVNPPTGSGSPYFAIIAGAGTSVLPPRGAIVVHVQFAPLRAGTFTANILVTSNATAGAQTTVVQLRGSARGTLRSTPTPTSSRAPTPTSAPTQTATPTATPTSTRTSTPTATRTATPTFTPTRTATSTATSTSTRTSTPTATRTATPTPTLNATRTITPTATATRTAIGTPTATSQGPTPTSTASAGAPTDVLTYHNDNARTGLNQYETILTTSNVTSSTFGKLFTASVDGKVDAQPLIKTQVTIPGQGVHNVLYVVTEHDSVYAFDADNGAMLWKVTALGSGETPSDNRGCSQVTPEIGITSTPVIDMSTGAHGTIYVVAMSKNASGTYFQRIHALDITTGTEEFGGPVLVAATFPGNGDGSHNGVNTFDPKQYKDRAGLVLVNGIVYTAWSSHCDIAPYTGWVIGYGVNGQNALVRESVLDVTPNGSDGAIWQSGGGPAADSNGNIYFLDGNGTFDATNANGFPTEGDFGNGFLKLSTSGGLQVVDFFEPFNTGSESGEDADLGSGGAMLLPDMTDSNGATRHLAVGAGKDTNIYLVDRDNMGKFDSSGNSNIYQELAGALPSGEWATPAYFNGTLYYGGVNAPLQAFAFSQARLVSSPSSTSSESYAYPGTSPSVSANLTANAIVWTVENSGGNGVLHAYDASNLGTELYNSNQASGQRDFFSDNKFITPTIANGKVYVGTPNSVVVFGLLQ